jgi:hypothetical protein
MNPVWRQISFDKAICCIDAREAAKMIEEQISKVPESLSQIVLNFLDLLPAASSKSFTILHKDEVSACIQTCLLVFGSHLKKVDANMLEQIFQRITSALVQLLEDKASNYDQFFHVCSLLTLQTCAVLLTQGAFSTFRIYFSKLDRYFR